MADRERVDAVAAELIRQRCELLDLAAEFCRATSMELEPVIDLRPLGYRRTEEDSFIPGVEDDDLGDLHLASMFWNVSDSVKAIRALLESDPYNQRPIGSLTRGITETVGVISWIAKAENQGQRQARSLCHLSTSMKRSLPKLAEVDQRVERLKPIANRIDELHRATGYDEKMPNYSALVEYIDMEFNQRTLYSMFSSLSHPDAFFSMTSFMTNRQDRESQLASSLESVDTAIALPGVAIHAVEGVSRSRVVAEMSQTLLQEMVSCLRK